MTQARRRNHPVPQSTSAQVHTRRAYSDGRHGQLHLTTAYPSGGGFDERAPLICLHPAAASGLWFRSLLPELGTDRSVYAPDLPGHGHSDPLAGADLALPDYVAAIGDFMDSMRLRSVDVLGHQLGAAIAVELAVQRPQQIRRLVLVAGPDAGQAGAARTAKLTAVTQQSLLLHPADVMAAKRGPALPQHSEKVLAQASDEIYGSGAKDLARSVRTFLDR